ncbi:MAG: hypothetical protein RBT69_13500 [Spirochaetia bacterium]|jgi:hypothetical protein|nr:hypothetical protein [Spirochaetia bacterium]
MFNKNLILKTVLLLFIIVAAGGCYQMNEPTEGDLTLKANFPASPPARDPGFYDDEIWVVGIVLDASFENKLKELNRIEDIQDEGGEYADYRDDDLDDLWQDAIQKGAVRFDGGKFYFQFKMTIPDSDTGNFTISGIPANKKYFLYIAVFDDEVTSLDEFDEDPGLIMDIRYYDPAELGIAGNIPPGTKAGWYCFENWDFYYNDGDPYLGVNTEIWTTASEQPFTVEAGKSTTVDILLVDFLD